MSVKMKFGSKDIPFVYKGDKLVYPNPIKDGLLLWYDFKGMRNTDTNKEVAKDLSLNGNDGTLTNFNFTEGSGYKDNTLVFDGVDDSLTIPELELDETAMTVVQDGKVYSYEDDKVLAIKDYSDKALTYLESLRAKGRNLLRDSYFKEGSPYFSYSRLDTEFSGGTLIATNQITTSYPRILYRPLGNLIVGEEYTISFKAKADSEFSASFGVSDANSANSQFYSQMIPYTKKWERYSYTFTVNERFSDLTAIQWWVNKTNPDTAQTLYLKEIKLEKGEIATDWAPAPEDVRENLPGLEAGGRNYILNSENGIWLWSNNTITQPYNNTEFDEYHLYKTLEPSTAISTYTDKWINHPIGTKHMDSVEVLSSIDTYVAMNMKDLSNKRFFAPADTWTRIYVERTMTSDRERVLGIRTDRPVPDGLKYRKYMNHIGHTPMDWTPAPEDFQTTSLSPSSLSNLQLYNRPLRKDELLHNVESDGLKELVDGVVVQDGLVLHYDFSHESNMSEYKDKAFDYSGNGNHGVLQNFGYAEGSGYDEGLFFDGVDDYISTLQNKKISLTRGVSAEGVVRVSESGGVFAGRDISLPMSGGYRFLLQCQAERYFRIRIWSAGWAENIFFYTPEGKDVAYISFTYDLNKLKVYVNGELVIEQVFNQPLFDYYDEFLIGRYGGGGAEYMSGEVYSSRTYNRALTPEEITHNYQIEKEKFNII